MKERRREIKDRKSERKKENIKEGRRKKEGRKERKKEIPCDDESQILVVDISRLWIIS
jgi:hypothetical protein